MKKTLCLFCILILVFSLCACSESKELSTEEKEAIYEEVLREKEIAKALEEKKATEAAQASPAAAEATADVTAVPEGREPFAGTDEYNQLLYELDSGLASMPVQYEYIYSEENRQLTIYFMAVEGLHNAIRQNTATMEACEKFTVESLKISSKVSDRIKSATLDDGHCCMIFVDKLKPGHNYSQDEIIFKITDNTVEYSLTDVVRAEIAERDALFSNKSYESAKPASTVRPVAPTAVPSVTKPSEPVSQGKRNALRKAKDYLDVMPFSYAGLVDQLEFEGYSYNEAVYGADNCGADWNEQAAKKAADYLDIMPFSRQGLIDQLEFDGFTSSQAEYGVSRNGY